MSKLSFAISVKLLADEFKKGAKSVRDGFSSIQARIVTFASAITALDFSFSGFLTRLVDVTRESNRAMTVMRNSSGSVGAFADNMKFAQEMAQKYGVYVNDMTMNYAKFTSAATLAGMRMDDQRALFESLTRASASFNLSADETSGVFMAITQMIGKGKIQAEELRGQLGERMPIAMQAMAKACGVSVGELDKLMSEGKLMSADVLPKFATALTSLTPNVSTDNIETSLGRLRNAFKSFSDSADLGGAYKKSVDALASAIDSAAKNISSVVLALIAALTFAVSAFLTKVFSGWATTAKQLDAVHRAAQQSMIRATQARVAAEDALQKASARVAIASGNEVTAAKAAQRDAERKLARAQLAEEKAIARERAAAERSASVNTSTAWGTAYSAVKVGAAKLLVTLKALWSSFAPALIISAITSLIFKIKQMHDEAERVKNIFSDYRKEAEQAGNTGEVTRLKALLEVMNDVNAKVEDRITATQELARQMDVVRGKNESDLHYAERINDATRQRIGLLEQAARAEYYIQKKIEAEDKQKEIYDKYGGKDKLEEARRDQMYRIAYAMKSGGIMPLIPFMGKMDDEKAKETYDKFPFKGSVGGAIKSWNEAEELGKVIADAEREIKKNVTSTVKSQALPPENTPPAPPTRPSGKKSALEEAEEKYAQSLRELEARKEVERMSDDDYRKSKDALAVRYLTEAKASGDRELLESQYVKNLQEAVDHPLYDEVSAKLREVEANYAATTEAARKKMDAGLLTQQQYQEAIREAALSAADSAVSIAGTGEAARSFIEKMKTTAASQIAVPLLGKRDTTFDYKSSKADQLSGEKAQWEEYASALRAAVGDGATYLEDRMNAAVENVQSLDKALKLEQVREDVASLEAELDAGLWNGLKNGVSSLSRMGDAVGRMRETMEDVDASGWEKLMSVWEAMVSMVDGFLSIIKTIETLTEVTDKLTKAKQVESLMDTAVTQQHVTNALTGSAADVAASAVKQQTAATNIAASTAEGAAEAGKSAAKLPFPANLVAIGAAIAGAIALFSLIPKFAGGGIVGGGSTQGDKVLARVNSGEMILNKGQQSRLWKILDGESDVRGNGMNIGGRVRMRGSDLALVLENTGKKKGKKLWR